MNKRKWSTVDMRLLTGVVIFLLFIYCMGKISIGVLDWGDRINESLAKSAASTGPLDDLNNLTVNDNPTPPEKYNRVEQFGPAWKDVDHNGCDTRNDILDRDLTFTDKRNACVVTAGRLTDPYSGEQIDFRKEDASKVQIDHVVALENAWQSGAYNLTQTGREALANDPDNLLAVNGHDNMAKGSKSADQWMPPNSAYTCTYASKQVQIKNRYALTVTTPEKQALADALATCPTD